MPADAKLDLDNYLPYLVNRVGSIIAEQYEGEALAPYRLSIAMWRVAVVLAEKGGQRQIDLADLTSIEVSTLSRIVTRLVRMGVVTRTRSASSPREVMVKLTAKGRRRSSASFPSPASTKPTPAPAFLPRNWRRSKTVCAGSTAI